VTFCEMKSSLSSLFGAICKPEKGPKISTARTTGNLCFSAVEWSAQSCEGSPPNLSRSTHLFLPERPRERRQEKTSLRLRLILSWAGPKIQIISVFGSSKRREAW